MRTGPTHYGRLVPPIHTIRDPVATGRPTAGRSSFSWAIHKHWARDALRLQGGESSCCDWLCRHGLTVKNALFEKHGVTK